MPTAQLNIRVPAEHHDLIRAVAARLRQDGNFAEALAALVAGVAAPVAVPVAGDTIASILTRLESVEAQLADLRQKPANAPLVAAEPVEVANTLIAPEALPEPPQEPEPPQKRQTRKPWTEADHDVLRRIAAEGGTHAEAANELGRSESSVSARWKKLKLPPPKPKEYRVTRHRGKGPDSKSARVIYSHSDEASARRFYNDTLPDIGITLAMWRPDGSLVAHRSGPPKGRKVTPPT